MSRTTFDTNVQHDARAAGTTREPPARRESRRHVRVERHPIKLMARGNDSGNEPNMTAWAKELNACQTADLLENRNSDRPSHSPAHIGPGADVGDRQIKLLSCTRLLL